jgi:hypothetical protein
MPGPLRLVRIRSAEQADPRNQLLGGGMTHSRLSFLAGVVRWSMEHPGMEFIGDTEGRSVRFVITDEALAALSGLPSRGPEYDFDTFFEHEAEVHHVAAAAFSAARDAAHPVVITPREVRGC